MRHYILALFGLLTAVAAIGQPLASFNEAKHRSPRTLRYTPEGEDFVCVNGTCRYTRALYGGHTAFRLETSDRPVFAIYDKNNSQNISFRIAIPHHRTMFLDSVAHCEARYTAGRRSYRLADPLWGKGELHITALAFHNREGALWKIEARNMPRGTSLVASQVKIRAERLNRNGDMGVDPADSFEAPLNPQYTRSCRWDVDGELVGCYLVFQDMWLDIPDPEVGEKLFEEAEADRAALAGRIQFRTPDPYINTLGGALAVAADGIWDGEVWLHGAVGWRMPLSGWRAAYTGDALGWHDRARTHFDAYAASQVTDVANTIPHPAQDLDMNLARSLKQWGTPQYSNGYICRTPRRNDQMHHYDMNLCYIDELLWHLNWTGDLAYARQMWPVITHHLAWEKRNYDPNDDGLYDAYACIWASDALYYNSGAVTHSTAYNYRANKMAALIAEKIGEDPTPYRREADKILAGLNSTLWMPAQGHWAEYKDFMGHGRLHPSAGLWTIYHAMDGEVADAFQAYQATRYVDTEIPHIPVKAAGLPDEGYETISTTNWLPYSWSINNVAFAEAMHTALAYFQAGRGDAGFNLLKSSVLDGLYLGGSPGNFGQVSFYDAARGECYRDFGDPIGVASRVFIQGLYGVLPDALNGRLVINPRLPKEWPFAELKTPDLTFSYAQEGMADRYKVLQNFETPLALELRVRARMDKIARVTVNGNSVEWKLSDAVVGYPLLSIEAPATASVDVLIEWAGRALETENVMPKGGYKLGDSFEVLFVQPILEVSDPQHVLDKATLKTFGRTHHVAGNVTGVPGHRTFFVKLSQADLSWWQPVHVEVLAEKKTTEPAFVNVDAKRCEPVVMDHLFNATVTDIFRNQYLTPRSPYTTLQLPIQGIGEWCHPKTMADIDDSGVRAKVNDGLLQTSVGVPFRTPATGQNISFTSLWDNYPNEVEIFLSGKASCAYLLMAGSTNHMQCHIANGVIRIYYSDETFEEVELINPENWCPIEQDFFVDGIAFKLDGPRPYRLHLKSGLVSNDLERDLGISGVYGRLIDGGAGILLDLKLNPKKELKRLTLETLSNDVVMGVMGVTLQR